MSDQTNDVLDPPQTAVASAPGVETRTAEERSKARRDRIIAFAQGQGLLVMLAVIIIYFAVNSPYFLTGGNALTIGASAAPLGIMAITQTFLIISGGIDVSVGSVVALSGVILGILITSGWSFWSAAAVAVLAGAAVGAINAVLVVALKINPFIATLGTMSLFSGIAFTLTSGETRVVNDPVLVFLGLDRILGLPAPFFIFLVCFIAALVVERLTSWGRTIYAIGGNTEAARLSGLRVRGTQTVLYVLSGASAGLAGVLVTAQLASASPQVGANYLLSVVTAVILGGASLSGGRGTLIGTLIAVIILGVLANGFALLGWSTNAQTIALGLALILAVLLDQTTRKLRGQTG
jgi:ribose transport system permease protein